MICRVCGRQSRGWGVIRDDREVMFCSREHRDFFEMTGCTDMTDLERIAAAATLRPMGEYVAAVGMAKPFQDWTREQALELIEHVVLNFHRNLTVATGEARKKADALDDDVPF